jgi:hypothetical protein
MGSKEDVDMPSVVVPSEFRELLQLLKQQVELIDENGDSLGQFIPPDGQQDPDWPFSSEERESWSKEKPTPDQCRTLDDILKAAGMA